MTFFTQIHGTNQLYLPDLLSLEKGKKERIIEIFVLSPLLKERGSKG